MSLRDLLPTSTPILVIDDVKSARIAVCTVLHSLGYHRLLEAQNGEEGWEKLIHNREIGLIICDWQMPVLDGLEFAGRIANDVRFSDTPLIMVTQKSEWQDLAQATVAGLWGYLVKPISEEDLRAELTGVMTEWHDRRNHPCCDPLSEED